ncbi:hypothetical protein SAMN05660297_02733 [Natronincola peptidivorans]|uniref:Uncharacterized protein n=1 Tax=Natronincola peptidivorans TaxID=426128 RepID=A0A1I0FD95_9FIRM|nr:hypothetical protein [Natronincola peptidivorans]SET55172.1 hypothetical protein SAMN05660297_02733 [Natronincola peptidivorans]
MSKAIAKKEGKKIIISKSPQQIEKEIREERINENKTKQSEVIIDDVFQYLNDTNSRLEEMYDLIKSYKDINVT